MTPEFSSMLSDWLIDFEDFRKDTIQKLDYENLPKSGLVVDKHTWQARIQDFQIISSQIDSQFKNALDIGSWNGWLANKLSKKGLDVTAIDYFTHETDGMKAKKFYKNPNWNSIQMDIEDLSVFDEKFDLIVMNRCFVYFTNPSGLIDTLKELLSPNGKLIITGLNVVETEAEELKKAKIYFKEKYNRDIFFKKTKGYIDDNDLEQLKSKGMKLFLYSNLKNLVKKKWLGKNNVSYYGIYKQ